MVLDRSGQILGIYDKVHPVTTSPDYTVLEDGIFPGGEPPVFDLDFGRVGIQICFDAGFPETWAALASKGAKAIFWPSAYHGGFPLQAYAYLYHYYVITSVRTEHSRIIDPCGRVVAQTDSQLNFTVYDLNLDFVVAHYDFNYPIPDRLLDAYPGRVRITSYVEDGQFLVEPTDPTLTTAQMQAEWGFEPASQYFERHSNAYSALHAGRTPPVQTAAHGKREQYAKWNLRTMSLGKKKNSSTPRQGRGRCLRNRSEQRQCRVARGSGSHCGNLRGQLDGTQNRSLQNKVLCGIFWPSEMSKRKSWIICPN